MTLDEGHNYIYFFVAITYGKVSLWLWKSLENSENFFLLCGHPVRALLNHQNSCGIPRFPCDSTAFLFLFLFQFVMVLKWVAMRCLLRLYLCYDDHFHYTNCLHFPRC